MTRAAGHSGRYGWPMTRPESPAATRLTPDERAYVRRELDLFFSTLPRVADGFYLRTWRGGPRAGQPKLPLAAQGLVARGLMRLDATLRPPHLFFTEAGLAALRAMMADARLADPKAFAHVREELGIQARPGRSSAEGERDQRHHTPRRPCPAHGPGTRWGEKGGQPMVLYELRTYTLHAGKMAEAVRPYQELGFPVLAKGGPDRKLVGYFQPDTGVINRAV